MEISINADPNASLNPVYAEAKFEEAATPTTSTMPPISPTTSLTTTSPVPTTPALTTPTPYIIGAVIAIALLALVVVLIKRKHR